jgi:hypothetical protein
MTMIFVLLSVGVTHNMAFGVPITIDAIEDAGQYLGETAYLQIVDTTSHSVSASDTTKWNSVSDVNTYATAIGLAYWLRVESAGNIWSSDQIVGDTLSGLHAGTYRITPIGGAFERDSFAWSEWQGWWWEMHVKATGDSTDYILGAPPSGSSNGGYATSEEAFDAARGYYLDFDIAEGDSLYFWIQDYDFLNSYGNTIDNSGGLTFEVTKIPEPATMLLLGLGLMGIPGIRRFMK